MSNALFYAAPFGGPVSYGAYTFNNTTVTRLSGGPVYAKDGRTVTHNEWVITFRSMVENATGAEMAVLLAVLCEPGLRFVCVGRGLDTIVGRIDTATYRDISWGPKPRKLAVRPAGARTPGTGGPACFVDWEVEVAVPCCPNARRAGPMELTADVSFEIDYSGLATRRWAGELRIANNVRADGRGGTDSPDNYREEVTPDLLVNFDREFGPWVTSADRTTLTFEVIDRQRPSRNVPPPYIVGRPKCGHYLSTTKPGLRQWIERFTGEYELAQNAPDIYAPVRHFFEVFVGGRIEWLKQRLTKENAQSIIPLSVEIGEPNAFDRPVWTMSVVLSFNTDRPSGVILGSGLGRPLSNAAFAAQWQQYAKSLLTSSFSPYGVSRLSFDASDDLLIDGLCRPRAFSVSAGDADVVIRTGKTIFDLKNWFDRIIRSITEKASWVSYENRLILLPDTGNVEVRTLPEKQLPATLGVGAVVGGAGAVAGLFDAGQAVDWADIGVGVARGILGGGAGGLIQAGATGAANGAAGVIASLQQRVPDRFRVVMEGSAVRAKFPIPMPTLTEVGGVPVVAMYDRGRDYYHPSEMVRDVGGCPLFRSAWRLTFMPTTFPLKKPIGPLPNPMYD